MCLYASKKKEQEMKTYDTLHDLQEDFPGWKISVYDNILKAQFKDYGNGKDEPTTVCVYAPPRLTRDKVNLLYEKDVINELAIEILKFEGLL